MIAYLRLLRIGTVFSPAADVVAGVCLSGLPWSAAAVKAVAASACLYAAGMVLNDHADRALDAVHRPERPIPSGQVRPRSALMLGVALLAAMAALSPMLPYHGAMAVLVLLYDYLVKQNALAGALTMGTLRAANLAAAPIVIAGTAPSQMLLVAALVYGVYIMAVTVLGIFEDTPKVKPRAVLAVQMAPPLAAFLAVLSLPERWPATAIAGLLALAFCLRARGVTSWTRLEIRRSMTWLLLGTMIYTGLLCLGSARPVEAMVIFAAIPVARMISRHIALT